MNEPNKRFDGFTVTLLPDRENDWIAHFAELPEISACGDSPENALEELDIAWALAKESYLSDGKAIPIAPSVKEYSGQFNVRIDKRIHKALATEAALAGISLNALVAEKLALASSTVTKREHYM